MVSWDDGYVSDIVYTSNFYRETTPAWLATASLLLGHRPPDLSRPFRVADLGCGHGFTPITVAATCPQAEVWGFDFNPAHIESARNLARQAGVTNVRFMETSFADLAALPAEALPEFDFIVSHGVFSWISPANQRALVSVLGQRLRPGGLAYLSYNVTTGWGPMVPLRRLMQMMAEASSDRSDLAASTILDFIDKLRGANAGFFAANPNLESRIADIRKQDPRYIAHEFLNKEWNPQMFVDVAATLASVKCSYIGSATLSENIDAVSVPPAMVPLLGETKEQKLRETLRDFGSSQGFRRDIYRRGVAPVPAAEHQAMLNDLALAWTGMAAGDQVTITTSMGPLTGRPELYRPLLAMLESGVLSVRQAKTVAPFAGRSLPELLQAITLLVSGGYALPVMPLGDSSAARGGAARLNAAIARLNGYGGDLPRIAVPLTGSSINVDLLETLALGEILSGKPMDVESLSPVVMATLARSGRSVQRDGAPVTDPAAAGKIVAAALSTMLERRVPLLRTLGVLT